MTIAEHPRLISADNGPDPADISQCVHCGLCLQNCPTYLLTGNENESPRGRIHLVGAYLDGRAEPNEALRTHLDLCLACRNCEAVCPSGVPYGRIIEAARAQLGQKPRSLGERIFRRAVFQELLPHQGRLRLVLGLLRAYQKSGLQALARASGLLPDRLETADRLLRPLDQPFAPAMDVYPARGETKYRVGLLIGCVMPLLYGAVHAATIRVLALNGCEVHVPRDQVCCGALNVHGGEREVAAEMARQNFRAFLGRGLDAIVVNSAGCGSTMKEYPELVDSPESVEFAQLTKDVNEFLASIDLVPPTVPVRRTVTLQESCHLAHAQRIREAPRKLLSLIPGLDFRELSHPDLCCGSAGLYSLTQNDMSMRLLDEKMRDAASTGATTIATANPGCMMQLEAGLVRTGLDGEVVHVVQLLDEAYGGPAAGQPL